MKAFLIGVIFLVGAFFASSDYFEDRAELRAVRDGVSTVVDPIRGYTRYKSRGSTTYTAEFTFRNQQGAEVKIRKSFPEKVLRAMERGEKVTIRYVPGMEGKFRFEGETPSTLLLLIGIGLALAGMVSLWVAIPRSAASAPRPRGRPA